MTVFGDKQTFGVECEPIPPRGDELPECHFTYWIGGHAVGNYEFHAPICEVEGDLQHILQDRGHRRDDRLFGLPAAEIVGLLEAGLRGDEDLAQKAVDERWLAHRVSYSMRHGYQPEFGRDWIVYLVEGPDCGRIIFFEDSKSDRILEQQVPAGHVDAVLSAAFSALGA